MATEKRKRLLFAIMEFLQDCKETVDADEKKESIDIALQCISDSFSLDLTDVAQQTLYSIKPLNLLSIFDVYLKTLAAKQAPKAPPPQAVPQDGQPSISTAVPSAKPPVAEPVVTEPVEPTAEDRKKAEAKKTEGNKRMAEKQFDQAIKFYTEAIELDPVNAIYYSNRAAAYSQKGDPQSAIVDAKAAVKIDPTYSKAYGRLGLAHYTLGNFSEAVRAYEDALQLEPGNTNWRQQLQTSQEKLAQGASPRSAPAGGASANPLAGLAGMPGMPGMGGPGGLDFNSIMSNPMFQQMAQQLMSDPQALQNLMSNPMVQNMMGGMGGAGGRP
ncbi:hypothetical protein HDU93_002473 [Gonapodya sp. JEL0774]|nr:hypothetical protein HDU93_002473 [Gonapodya sp. JEL0774]